MFSIQKAFAKDDKFFELLEASAEESRASIQALKQVLKGARRSMSSLPPAERKSKSRCKSASCWRAHR